ncbi:MAG: nitroreductase family protein [Actinomycetota bacterium]|nr:nitroreductase family protein [Actinomycetota bacterium]
MNLDEVVAARRSVRAFVDKPVPRDAVERAIRLSVQAPAPHHSAPWRFALISDLDGKTELSRAMASAWKTDLEHDGHRPEKIEDILARSHRLLTGAPLLVICCADMARAHDYPDRRRERAEWSLFAHSVGAALQTFMLALTEDGIASCWISAPVFCGDTVQRVLDLPQHVEPEALVLVGYPAPDYVPRPRPEPNADDYVVADW